MLPSAQSRVAFVSLFSSQRHGSRAVEARCGGETASCQAQHNWQPTRHWTVVVDLVDLGTWATLGDSWLRMISKCKS